jgi:hypothetical protein
MTRFTLAALLAATLAGPWGGCDREPVTPPATPPPERAPGATSAPAAPPSDNGVLLLPDTRRIG